MVIPLPSEELQKGVGLETGAEYLGYGMVIRDEILQQTGLEPTGSVLDVGCGSGRIARHFVDHTKAPGRYVGMDIQKPFIDWCTGHLSPANGRLEFYHQDIYNGAYNREGTGKASEYAFPFEDASFDVVVLYSVFTHLLAEDARNYLREISRLLKPGGRCFSSWFLMTPDVQVEYLLPNAKEGQVGYGFPHCVDVLEEAGLRVDEYRPGRWNGGKSNLWQDVLWLGKAEELPQRYPPGQPPAETSGGETVVSGTIESLDPVASTLVVADARDGSRQELGFSPETGVRAHGRPAALSDLRVGQEVRVTAIGGPPDRKVASTLVVRARPRVERVLGIIEAVDWETNVVTVSVIGKGSMSLRVNPDRTVRIDGRDVGVRELKPGQVALVQVVPLAQAVVARDPAAAQEGSPAEG